MAKKVAAQDVPQPEGTGLVSQLQNAIRDSGQTLNQLSKQCGVARSTLSRFMRGKQDLGLTAAEKICEFLGLRLAGGEGASALPGAETTKGKPRKAKKE